MISVSAARLVNKYSSNRLLMYIGWQILSISCDNASNNDAMISKLADLVEKFPGEANQIRCFLHILNLVMKSVICQFDLPKAQADGILDEAKAELLKLAGNLELEEITSQQESGADDDVDDSVEGWVDERREMTEMEVEELDKSVGPLRLMLTKVSDVCQLSSKLTSLIISCASPLLQSRTQQQ
jgi:hypothetical protein